MITSLPAPHQTWLTVIRAYTRPRNIPTYLVGGIVRDLLLGVEIIKPDLDIVFEGEAITIARKIAAAHGGKLSTHPSFHTAVWHTPDGLGIDFITARRETYASPAVLPAVTPASLREDLARRDFSINTLAIRLDDDILIDQHNGQRDLQNRIIRVLHEHSFIDDPTRLYRAVRYEQRNGRFTIESGTLRLIAPALAHVALLSHERVRHELDLMTREPHFPAMLARLKQLGLLNAILDDLPWDDALPGRLDAALRLPIPLLWGGGLPVNGLPFREIYTYLLWMAPARNLAAIHARMNFALPIWKNLQAASALLADLPGLVGASPSGWARRLEGVPLPALLAVYTLSGESALEQYVRHWKNIHPLTDGNTLKARGLPPGPRYQQILSRLRAAWLDSEIDSPAAEQTLLETLL